jgi:hypothetical protein
VLTSDRAETRAAVHAGRGLGPPAAAARVLWQWDRHGDVVPHPTRAGMVRVTSP